jgi:hypothetical protein
MVVVVTSRPEGGGTDYDQVTVACTRDQFREPADREEDRMKLFFTVDGPVCSARVRRSTPLTSRSEIMTPETIQSVLKMRPFRAFQIHTSGGGVYPS